MKVNTAQLATWIERDGWVTAEYHAYTPGDGGRTYGPPPGDPFGGRVHVTAEQLPELESLRDAAWERYRKEPTR